MARIAIIGGGASGMFAAAAAAESVEKGKLQVVVFEGGKRTMSKVAISGGGRCNVLHDTSLPAKTLLQGYPRGRLELQGIFHRHFTPQNAQEWFQRRGVELKTESDGRMFPVTDQSQTIIDTIQQAAQSAGVEICTREKVVAMTHDDDSSCFCLTTTTTIAGENGKAVKKQRQHEPFDCIILATGSSPDGYAFAQQLGHSIVSPAPSLFTLTTKHQMEPGQVLAGLAGVSLPKSRLTWKRKVPGGKKTRTWVQEGPLLITHSGLSGPAALRLSSFAAREFQQVDYQTNLTLHWAPLLGTVEDIETALWSLRSTMPRRAVGSSCPLQPILVDDDDEEWYDTVQPPSQRPPPIPRRLWSALAAHSGFVVSNDSEPPTLWANASKKKIRALAHHIAHFDIPMTGRGVFKEEFVTAGGVALPQIDMKTLQSKTCPGFFCCGEVLNVDGVTGGYNFMNCWSTGYLAGRAAAQRAVNAVSGNGNQPASKENQTKPV